MRAITNIFIALAIASTIAYVVSFFIDEKEVSILNHASCITTIVSFYCSIWVAYLAASIKMYRQTNKALIFLSSFIKTIISPEKKKSENGIIQRKERLILRSQIKTTLCVAHLDQETKKLFKKVCEDLKSEECYYDDILFTLNTAIEMAHDNNH